MPKGTLRDLRSGLDAIRKQHAQLRQYIRTTADDLRSRLVERQGSDAYQWALLMSTHEQRHILQIREIKAIQVSRTLTAWCERVHPTDSGVIGSRGASRG